MDEFHLLLTFFLPCLVWTLSTYVIMGCIRSCFASAGPQSDVCKKYDAVKVTSKEEDIQRLENIESLKQNYDGRTKEFGSSEEREGFLPPDIWNVNETKDTVITGPEFETQQHKENVEELTLLDEFEKENSQLKKNLEESDQQLIDLKEKYKNDLKIKQEQLSSKENKVIKEKNERTKTIQELETKHKEAVEQFSKESKILENENSQLKKDLEKLKQHHPDQINDLKVKKEQVSSKEEDEVSNERKEMTKKIQNVQESETKYKETMEQITKESKINENRNSQLKKGSEVSKQYHFDKTVNYENDLKVKKEQLSSKKKDEEELQELETKYKENVEHITNESKILEKENSQLKKDLDESKQHLSDLTEKYENDLKVKQEQLSSKEDEVIKERKEMAKKVQELQELQMKYKESVEQITKESKEHEEKKIRLEKEIENVRKAKESEIRAILEERNKITSLYNALKSQKSTHESAKNAYEREGVENMNDEFSNSKLAAKFTEIEKEEWLNAFESLQAVHGELSAIERISLLIKQAYLLCIQSSDNVTRVLLGLDENDKLPPQIESNVSDARREQLQHEHMKKEIVESVLKDSQDRSTELRVFLHKYVECCLLLVISRPEIKLYFDVKGMCYDGELKRRFRKYCTGSPVVKSGVQADTVIEVVWPELNDYCGIHRKGIIVAVDMGLDC